MWYVGCHFILDGIDESSSFRLNRDPATVVMANPVIFVCQRKDVGSLDPNPGTSNTDYPASCDNTSTISVTDSITERCDTSSTSHQIVRTSQGSSLTVIEPIRISNLMM